MQHFGHNTFHRLTNLQAPLLFLYSASESMNTCAVSQRPHLPLSMQSSQLVAGSALHRLYAHSSSGHEEMLWL